jgi:hypothetical protein
MSTTCNVCLLLDILPLIDNDELNLHLEICTSCFHIQNNTVQETDVEIQFPKTDVDKWQLEKIFRERIAINDADRLIIEKTSDFFTEKTQKYALINDCSNTLATAGTLQLYFPKIHELLNDSSILIIDVYPITPVFHYFKNVLARPVNYFSTKSMKTLVERYGFYLVSSTWISSSEQIFFVSNDKNQLKEFHNIDQVLAFETSIGLYNLASCKDAASFIFKTLKYDKK